MKTLTEIQWPDVAETVKLFKGGGPGAKSQRFYRHVSRGWERPGVTTIIDAAYGGGKEYLIRWAAGIEKGAALNAAGLAWDELKGMTPDHLDAAGFVSHVEKLLGKGRAHERAKEKAGDIGTAAHEMVQWTLRGQLGLEQGPKPVLPDESLWAYMAWSDTWAKAGITPLRMEQPIWSDRHGYAGTIDLIGIRDGKLGIVDVKTSKYVYDSGHLQVAAYWEAADELLFRETDEWYEIEWAELWKIPKVMSETAIEAVPLGQLYDRKLTRADLTVAFLALKTTYDHLCRPQAKE